MAKSAAQRQEKPAPVDNPVALQRMAEERRRSIIEQKPNKFEAKRSRALEEAFLDGLRDGWSVRKSAWAAQIDTASVYAWRNKSEASRRDDGSYVDDFALRWEQAFKDGVDVLEDAAHRRGVHGVERPVYQGGVMVGTVTEYSDTLLALSLRGKRPDRYNTERHELSGPGGGPVAMSMELEFIDPPRSNRK